MLRVVYGILAQALLACAVAFVLLTPRAAMAKPKAPEIGEPLKLQVPGQPDVYYYKPVVRGQRPILMYLHGRGGRPAEDCRKWARVATQFGWVVCPQGPEEHVNGGRTWANGISAQRIIDRSVAALKDKYGSKVQRWRNILIGFSEGALVAMQIGLRDQRTWDRWLILGANDQYWQQDISEELAKDKRTRVRRVYLLTGEHDQVADQTRKVGDLLKKNKVSVKVKIVPGLGHKVPSDKMITTYRGPLLWLDAAE